jgi:HEAT repeat protein
LAAITELSEQASPESAEAIGPLATALKDSDAGVRAAAAQALGLIGSYSARSAPHADLIRDTVSRLLESLKDPEPKVRVAAAGALKFLSASSAAAIQATGKGKGKGRGKTKGESEAKVSQESEAAPSLINPAVVASSLIDLLGDPDIDVRQAALFALGSVAPIAFDKPPPPLFAAAEDRSTAVRVAAIGTLVGFPRGLDPLIPSLVRNLEKDDPAMSEASLTGLIRIRPTALTAAATADLIAGLRSRNRDVRLRLVTLLSRISPDPAITVPALIDVLREPVDSDVQTMGDRRMMLVYEGPAHSAARALSRIARKTALAGASIAALSEVVKSGPAQRKASAAAALGEFGPAAVEAVPALITMLEQDVASKKLTIDGESASNALGRIAPGTPSASLAVTALATALKAESIATREAAIEALEHFGAAASATIPALREIQEKDKVPNARKAAKSTLEALEGGSKS